MSKCVRSARVRRVSSQATRSTSRRTRSARRVMSSRLPIGVATTKSVPIRLRRLLWRFGDEQGPLVVQDDLARDDALLEPLDGRQLVHDLEHDLLQDRPESPRAGPPLERLLRDRRHRVVRELQADLLEVEILLVLPGDRVLRLPEDADQRGLVEVVERRDDRQPADELGDEPVLQEILGLDHHEEGAHPALLTPLDLRAEAHARASDARLRDRGGVGDGEGHPQHLGERLCEEGLAGARGADQEDVRFLQLDLARLAARLDPLVVVVDRDGEDFLRPLLADHVLVEDILDLRGLGKRAELAALLLFPLLGDDVVAELDALVADVDRRARDQFADVVLALPAEGALQRSVAFARSGHRLPTSSPASPAPAPRPPPASSAWTRSPRRRFYIPSPARRS